MRITISNALTSGLEWYFILWLWFNKSKFIQYKLHFSSYLQSRIHQSASSPYWTWWWRLQHHAEWSTSSCQLCLLGWCSRWVERPQTLACSASPSQSWGLRWQRVAWWPQVSGSWSWQFPDERKMIKLMRLCHKYHSNCHLQLKAKHSK